MIAAVAQPVSAPASGAAPATADRRWLNGWQALGRPLDPDDPTVIRHAASQMVSELFFKPLLAELRESPLGADFANGGQTEAIFGARLDEQIADAVAATDRSGLVNQIAEELGAPPQDETELLAAKDEAEAAQEIYPASWVSWFTQVRAQLSPEEGPA